MSRIKNPRKSPIPSTLIATLFLTAALVGAPAQAQEPAPSPAAAEIIDAKCELATPTANSVKCLLNEGGVLECRGLQGLLECVPVDADLEVCEEQTETAAPANVAANPCEQVACFVDGGDVIYCFYSIIDPCTVLPPTPGMCGEPKPTLEDACNDASALVPTLTPNCGVDLAPVEACVDSLTPGNVPIGIGADHAMAAVITLETIRAGALASLMESSSVVEYLEGFSRAQDANPTAGLETLLGSLSEVHRDPGASVPSEALAALALANLPRGSQTAFHQDGDGGEWFETLSARFLELEAAILASYSRSETDEAGWPEQSHFDETETLRNERAAISAALSYLGFYQANSNGNIPGSADVLGHVALLGSFDYYMMQMNAAAPSLEETCGTAGALSAQLLVLAGLLVTLVGDNAEWAEGVITMTFVDALWTAADASEDLEAPAVVGPAYGIVNDVTHEETQAPVQDAIASAHEGLAAMIQLGADKDPQTDTAAGKWGVDVVRSATEQTGEPWTLVEVNAPMPEGYNTALENSPVTLAEVGEIRQESDNDHVVWQLVDEPPRDIVIQPDPKECDKEAAKAGSRVLVAGAAGAGIGAAGGPWTAVAGGIVGAGVQTYNELTGAKPDECLPKTVHDPGRYAETGAFVNRWWDFSWTGQGIAGFGQILGSASIAAAADFIDGVPYTNHGATTGYAYGTEMARHYRDAAREASDEMTEQFRPVKGTGSLSINIHIACVNAPTELLAADGAPPAAEVCLEAYLVNPVAAGSLEGEGYTCEIEIAGVATSGYIETNGQQVPFPVALEMEGAGAKSP